MDSGRNAATTSTGGGRTTPRRNPDFAHLTLDQLRTYRAALGAEETRVSYWRRVVQARLDILRAGVHVGVAQDHLRRLLSDGRCVSRRSAFLAIVPADGIPPVPDLTELWAEDGRDDPEHAARLERALAAAEEQLSAYRAALHDRLSDATAELIARYHEDPTLALVALPTAPPSRTGTPSSRSGTAPP
ncbi:MAG: hypothetical protein ACM3ZF_07575 [Mycobacterium leprae]